MTMQKKKLVIDVGGLQTQNNNLRKRHDKTTKDLVAAQQQTLLSQSQLDAAITEHDKVAGVHDTVGGELKALSGHVGTLFQVSRSDRALTPRRSRQ